MLLVPYVPFETIREASVRSLTSNDDKFSWGLTGHDVAINPLDSL